MSIETFGGRKKLTVEDYLSRIAIDHPRVVVAMADEVSWLSTRKRLAKAADRTLRWFQDLKAPNSVKGKDVRWDDVFLFGVAFPPTGRPADFAEAASVLINAGISY